MDHRLWVLLAMAIGSAGLYAALRTAITLVIVLIISMAMLLFATWLAKWVLAKDEGTADMQDVSGALTRIVRNMFGTMYCILSLRMYSCQICIV